MGGKERGMMPKQLELRQGVLTLLREHKAIEPQSLLGMDFSGCDLSGIDFSGWDLRQVDFRAANLTRTRFQYALLTGARFQDISLQTLLQTGLTPKEALVTRLHAGNTLHFGPAGIGA